MIDPNASAFISVIGGNIGSALTIRAYIASQQMAALIGTISVTNSFTTVEIDANSVARKSITLADALIEELNKHSK